MVEAPFFHLFRGFFVPQVEGLELAPPAPGLGVARVPVETFRDDRPDGVYLGVLAEEVAAAEEFRVQVPYAHWFAFLSSPFSKGGLRGIIVV